MTATTSSLATARPLTDRPAVNARRRPLRIIRGTLDERPTLGAILFVCQANVSRSAYMDLMLRHLAEDAGLKGLQVRSAGLQAIEGTAAHDEVRGHLARLGLVDDDFHATQLTRADVEAADLVLTATRRQRDEVGRMAPRQREKMFTILQLNRLLTEAEGPAPDGRSAVARIAELADRRRGIVPSAGSDDDVADPTGRRSSAFASTFSLLQPALTELVNRLSTLPTSTTKEHS